MQHSNYQLPKLDNLDQFKAEDSKGISLTEREELSLNLVAVLKELGVIATVDEIHEGPSFTRFSILLSPGTCSNSITQRAEKLASLMGVKNVRVVEFTKGKPVVGIEIPNNNLWVVHIRGILGSPAYTQAHLKLPLVLGNEVAGNPVVIDLAKAKNLLMMGITGSGVSVATHVMVLSLLYKVRPSEVRLLMVDPKMLELSVYDGIPHLLTPVITDMNQATEAFRWCATEMERRCKLLSQLKARDVEGFNRKVHELGNDELLSPQKIKSLPRIIVIVEELSDLLMTVGQEVAQLIASIALKARRVGIHLILAAGRQDNSSMMELIKAYIPNRIAFQLFSEEGAQMFLGQSGAEKLQGYGDMLYLSQGNDSPTRIQGAFVYNEEIYRTVEDCRMDLDYLHFDGRKYELIKSICGED